MTKKILGILFYFLGAFFVLSVYGNIRMLMDGHSKSKGVQIGAIILATFLAFLFFYYAYKWTLKKKKKPSEIEDIGNDQK